MRAIKKIRLSLLIVSGLLLTACFGSPSSVPEDRFYTLKISAAEKVTRKYKRIAITKVYAHGLYNERALLYAKAELPLQIKRYHYHHWVMPPTQLIQHALSDYLKQSNIAKDVMVQAIGSDEDLRVSAQLLAFERVLQSEKQSVRVELEFTVRLANGSSRVFNYIQNITTKKNTLHSAAEAYGVALAVIFKAFLADLDRIG